MNSTLKELISPEEKLDYTLAVLMAVGVSLASSIGIARFLKNRELRWWQIWVPWLILMATAPLRK